MKKSTLFIGAMASLFLLAGCQGKSTKEEFISALESQSSKEYNAADFDFSIDDIKSNSDEEGSAQVAMIAAQLKDMKFSGSTLTEEDGKNTEVTLNAELFGQKIPVKVIKLDEKAYVSGETYTGIIGLMSSFGTSFTIDEEKTAELKTKYIPFSEDMLEESGLGEQADVTTDTELLKELQDGKLNDLLKKYVDTKMTDDDFKKDGDKISHTFTKEEILDFAKYVKENGSKTLKQYVEDSLDPLEDIDKSDFKITADTKTSKLTMKMDVGAEGTEVKMTINVTPKKSKDKVTEPNKLDVISEDEVSDLMDEAMGSATSADDEDADLDADALEDYELTDEEFKEIYDELVANKDDLTAENIEEYLDAVGSLFTDEQVQQIRDLVK